MTNKRVLQMAEINEISCEVTERVWTTALRHWSGHQRVEGREGDQKPLGEGLSKEKARRGGRAGIWLRRQHATRRGGGGVGRTMWWPYAPSGEMSDDDDGQIDASPKLLWLSKGASSYVVSSRVKADIRGAWGDCLARSLRDSALASLSSRVTG